MPAQDNPSPLAALHGFAEHLEARARSGQQRLWMTDEARSALKEIIRMKPGRMTFRKPSSLKFPTPTPTPTLTPPFTPTPSTNPAPLAPSPSPSVAPSLPPSVPPSLSRADQLAAISRRAETSPKARALGTLRDIMVFATGSPDADLMLVGEAPGAQEEKLREPFVGPAGQLLDRVLKAMGLQRSQVYISNICKFRPKTEDGSQGTGNRKPTLTEMQSCLDYVHEEIAIIQPKVIIALGGTAAEGLLQRPVTITRVRGQWLECQGIPLMLTFHPSYLLHREKDGEAIANAEKRLHWEDMLQVMESLHMPISDKQRRFFLPKSS